MGVLEVQDVTEGNSGEASSPKSKSKMLLITVLGLTFLAFFTLIKIPEPRLKSVAIGYLNYGISQMGYQIIAPDSDISYWKGPELILRNASLVSTKSEPIHFDEIRIKPLILPIFIGKLGAEVQFTHKKSFLDVQVLMRGKQADINLLGQDIDLEKIPLTALLSPDQMSPLQSKGLLNVKGNFYSDLEALHTLSGTFSLKIQKFTLESFSVSGLTVPNLNLSEILLDMDAQNGKIRFQKGAIGKSGTADDIQATVAGDVTLSKLMETSTLNLKMQFKFSDQVLKSFSILDAMLSPGKRADGLYAFSLTGSPRQPNFTPIQ